MMKILAVFFLVYAFVAAMSMLYLDHHAGDVQAATAPADDVGPLLERRLSSPAPDAVRVEVRDAAQQPVVAEQVAPGEWLVRVGPGHYTAQFLNRDGEPVGSIAFLADTLAEEP